ncbi:MAG: UDP-N-acetylmuramate dehydrogenase [Candidatus Omnitrophota bacterium]
MRKLYFETLLYGKVLFDEPLSLHTSMKVGGPATLWIEPQTTQQLCCMVRLCRKAKISVFTIGEGCNIIVGKNGIPDVCIKLASAAFTNIAFNAQYVKSGAGVLLKNLLKAASERSLGGGEFLAGIPGTVGGAIFGNAGSQNKEISSLLEEITVIDKAGRLKTIKDKDIKFSYRYSGLSGNIIISALFEFKKNKRKNIDNLIRKNLREKIKKQDYTAPSAGCIFKNVTRPKISAGQLIEACGLKARAIGAAQVSGRHANFIVNKGNACPDDVLSLIKLVKDEVKTSYGINLEEEVSVIR